MSHASPIDWSTKKVVAISGGVGGARLVHGLARRLPEGALTVIANTGDDFEHLGVWVSPDCDTLLYTLAGLAPHGQGWGIEGDTFHALSQALTHGAPDWFQLGDRDLGTNLVRTARMRAVERLTTITEDFCHAHSLPAAILPMSDTPHPTIILDTEGVRYGFQEWLVRHRGRPPVARVELGGDKQPTQEVLAALREADLVIMPPSNPFLSLDPILALEGVRPLLREKKVIGVSPILRGEAVKGPLAAMIPLLQNVPARASAVGRYYHDLLDAFVVEDTDVDDALPVMQVSADTLMSSVEKRDQLADTVLEIGSRWL